MLPIGIEQFKRTINPRLIGCVKLAISLGKSIAEAKEEHDFGYFFFKALTKLLAPLYRRETFPALISSSTVASSRSQSSFDHARRVKDCGSIMIVPGATIVRLSEIWIARYDPSVSWAASQIACGKVT
jgi:hypothetical protein